MRIIHLVLTPAMPSNMIEKPNIDRKMIVHIRQATNLIQPTASLDIMASYFPRPTQCTKQPQSGLCFAPRYAPFECRTKVVVLSFEAIGPFNLGRSAYFLIPCFGESKEVCQ